MIRFQNITKIYPPRFKKHSPIIALDNVNFKIDRKEFVSIVGRSGAGKSTLIKLLLAEERPTRGRIFFDDQEIQKIKYRHLPKFRRRIGAIFQDYKLLASKTVFENIAYVLEVIGGFSNEQISRNVLEVLEIVGLSERINNFPIELSGGEQQRVAIARALIHRPEIILADEVTGNLDPYHTNDIINLLLKINEMGTTVVLATHDKEIINRLNRRVITLEEGKVIRDEEKGKFIL